MLVTGTDFTTVHDQPAPEGSPDDERTTTSTTATTAAGAGREHHVDVVHDDDDRGRLCHRRASRRRRLRLIVTIIAGSQARPIGGVTSRYQYANGLCRLGHEVHLVHASWFQAAVTSLDELDWFEFDDRIEHHFVEEGRTFEFPRADLIGEPNLLLPPEYGLPFRFIQGVSLSGGGVGQQLARPCPSICVARWIYELCIDEGVPEHLLTHIPNGIDAQRFRLTRPIEDRRPQVSMLYHHSPIKGAADGLAALELVHEAVPEADIVLFGREAPERRLPEWVTYHEHAPQEVLVEEVYNRASVFLCSSRWGEGFGKTPLEAMACGAALVTTDNGGSRDYAQDGETALVSGPGDPDALGTNVVSLLRDDERRIGLATRGHRLASGFTWDRSARALEATLEAYLADARSIDLPHP